MAKKNSTKTATKEALQASEPRIQAINGWKGVNFQNASVCWDEETHESSPKDLDDANLLIEDNVDIDSNGCLVTRAHEETVFTNVIDGWFLTGVAYLKGKWLYMALENGDGLDQLIVHDVTDTDTTSYLEVAIDLEVTISDENPNNTAVHPDELSGSYYSIQHYTLDSWQTTTGEECVITDIYSYLNDEQGYLIVMARVGKDSVMFIGEMDDGTGDENEDNDFLCTSVRNRAWIPTPAECGDMIQWNTRWGWRVEKKYNKNPKMMMAWTDGCIFRITPSNPSGDPADSDYLRLIDESNSALYNWEEVDPELMEWELSSPDVTTEDTSYYDVVSSFTFIAIYTNDYGSTTLGGYASCATNVAAADFTYSRYLSIFLTFKPQMSDELLNEITSIQLYVLANESTTPVYIGMIERPDTGVWEHKETYQCYYDVNNADIESPYFWKHGTYRFDWYGSTGETDSWSHANLNPSKRENTTTGPDAAYVRQHDGRLYWWGSSRRPYRLIIGGDTGTELNISQGYGGGYLDVEPGVGTIVNGTQKWKTASGASIVTILCGNTNTRQAKRFNLIETNIQADTEYSATSYMFEEISNTVGCQSNWGSGVWADGLYVVDRYGLLLTSMAMEYNTQVQEQTLSDAVRPIFTDELGTIVRNARIVYIDQKIYIIFGTEGGSLNRLDDVVLVYDIDKQAWWTYTYLPGTDLKHVINIDYVGRKEGLGLITDYGVDMIPTTSPYENASSDEFVRYFLESGEILCTPVPRGQWAYVAQLQLWFDWFIGDMDIELRATDYYGRNIEIDKHLHTDECLHDYRAYIRVNSYLESFRLKITGTGTFRLTHLSTRSYSSGKRYAITRGWDALDTYRDAHGNTGKDHCYIKNYANLRNVLLT